MTCLRALVNGAASLVKHKGKLRIWTGKPPGTKASALPVQETEEKHARYELVGV